MSDIVAEARRVADEVENLDLHDMRGWAGIRAAAKIGLLVEHARELAGIVERLPQTADGVPITPHSEVWTTDSDSPVAVKMWGELQVSIPQTVYCLRGCYSTREAACAAREAARGGGQ